MTLNQSAYLNVLSQRVLVFDGAMGTNLALQHLTADQYGGPSLFGCNDCLVLSSPAAVEKVHRSFLEVGVDVIETNTFRANRATLAEFNNANQVQLINHSAAMLARRLADEFSTPSRPRFVAGSMGPTGHLLSSNDPVLCRYSFDEIVAIYAEQAQALLDGGVDLFLIETAQDILEVKAAILGIRQVSSHLPIQAQVTLDVNGRMLLGTDISAVLATLQGMPIQIIGINCSTGPEHMRAALNYLAQNSTLPISCLPNAGIPFNQLGKAVYPLQPRDFADQMLAYVEKFGLNVVGGCCGTTPEHLHLLVQGLQDHPAPPRDKVRQAVLSSSISALAMHQQPTPLMIGERLNTQGSRRFKQVVLDQDWQSALAIAHQQVENGAHALDLCVALTEKNTEAQDMATLVKSLATAIDAPLVIDTTDPLVMETALKHAPGRCLLNSTHLESGLEKARSIFKLARQFNAAVICLTIDKQGMAKTAQRKLQVARRIHDLATGEFGLQPSDLVFDPLTFTLASGDAGTADSALQTLESIRLIKEEMPGVFTSLGVSNVSFGLSPHARAVLNSVMLYHALQAGLDMAILNPASITPYPQISPDEKRLAENLLLNRHPGALAEYIAYFEEHVNESISAPQSDTPSLDPPQRVTWHILNRVRENLQNDIDLLIDKTDKKSSNRDALYVLNQILLPAMKTVGELFGRGELILPFVLQSAEVMKAAVTHLEQYLQSSQATSKGKLVLATVYGDVHDIGKNLVKTILANNGYEVIDLGKQVPAEEIIQTAIDQKAHAIGLSALLVSTSQQMALVVAELQRRKASLPVLIGGAAINQEFADRIARTEEGQPYAAGVYYCRDAFDALAVMEKIVVSKSSAPKSSNPSDAHQKEKLASISPNTSLNDQQSIPLADIPTPPFWGPRLIKSAPLQEVLNHLDRKALYRLSWGAKNATGDKWERLSRDFDQRFDHMIANLQKNPWLELTALYGYWPAQSNSNTVFVYDPTHPENPHPQPVAQFEFPRQPQEGGLCLADYFASRASGRMDVVAFQIVTVGKHAIEYIHHLYEGADISEGYFAHGLAVQLTEALAQYTHTLIRHELGLGLKQGKRYSWGYPAMPDLSQHEILFRLLPAHQQLGMSLTSAYQLVPELSTAAMLVHHPRAEWFTMR